jgi:hypothetical protein
MGLDWGGGVVVGVVGLGVMMRIVCLVNAVCGWMGVMIRIVYRVQVVYVELDAVFTGDTAAAVA